MTSSTLHIVDEVGYTWLVPDSVRIYHLTSLSVTGATMRTDNSEKIGGGPLR